MPKLIPLREALADLHSLLTEALSRKPAESDGIRFAPKEVEIELTVISKRDESADGAINWSILSEDESSEKLVPQVLRIKLYVPDKDGVSDVLRVGGSSRLAGDPTTVP